MENFSHSRHPNRATTAALSKKICGNAGGGCAVPPKTLYDDVYGGPPKFGVSSLSPRMEDYSEIFGSFQASRASSIPVLDLPAVDEAEVFFDVRSSSFDYAEVFGGFNGLDFAVSYEELVDQSKSGDGDSSEEPWSPAEFESLSEESDVSGKVQSFSNGSPDHSFDGSTEFNISYHKANQISSEDISNGVTHVTKFHALQGFTVMVDSPLQQTEDKRTFLQETDDSNISMDLSVDMMKAKHPKKTMSHPPNGSVGGLAFENDLRPQKGCDGNGFLRRDMFVGISEISLRTQPSELPPPCRAPPALEGKKGDSSKLVPDRSCLASEGISGDNSPPFFDVEVDASSSAAASAAAIKEAMERAQAKIKSAKELMEKKKGGLQTSYKSGSKKDKKVKEGKTGKSIDGSNKIKDKTVKSAYEREDSGTNLFVREEKQKVTKTAPEVAEFLEEEKTFTSTEKYVKDISEKESWSSRGSHKINEANEWKEATEFFELVTTDESMKAFELVNSKKSFLHNTMIHENEQIEKATMESFEKHSENGRKVRAAREDNEQEKFEKKQKGTKEPRGHEENIVQLKGTKQAYEHKDGEKKIKMGSSKRSGADKSTKEKKTAADKSKVEQAVKQGENDQKLMEADKMVEIEEKLELFHVSVDNEETQREAFNQDRNVKFFEEAFEQAENEKKESKGLEQEESEKWLKEIFEKVESERRQEEAVPQQENGKRLKQPLEQEINKKKQKEAVKLEDEKRPEETHKREVNVKIPKSADGEKETRNSMKACEQEDNTKRFTESQDKEEREEKLLEEFKQLDTQNMPKEFLKQEKTVQLLKDAVKWEDKMGLDKEHEGMEKDENNMEVKLAKGTQVHMEDENLLQPDEAHKLDCGENTQSSQFTCHHDENSGKLKTTQESLAHKENSDARTEPPDNEMQPEAAGRKNKSVDKDIKAPGIAEMYPLRMEDAEKDFPLDGTLKKTSGEIKIKPKDIEKESGPFGVENVLVGEKLKAPGKSQGNLEHGKNHFKVEDAFELPHLDNQVKKVEESASVLGQPYAEKNSSQVGSVSENQVKEFAHQWKERGEDCTQAKATLNQEKKEKTVPTQLVKENTEDKRKTEMAQPSRAEEKQKIQKSGQQGNAGLAAERKEKTSGDVETERMKRERELENERLRKIEEEREREREREKDRMAVDLATLEARERAFSESRERTERAAVERVTAEARQRAMAEARERLEKACAEAREKSLAGKAAMEARIRAERTAVERATAEARERAAEKAMAERAAFEARERVQRSVSDKFSASSRNNVMRQSSSSSDLQDLQFQSSQGHLRYQYSSVYGERYEGVEGESAQRCKARLERHRRTAERAAKALAEKNMRDLLAQREQAERHRLAETLDADVRRWSSGKEGNLRALLSTLQYILGPDSGWQPVPLTEVITSAAVKKAYRKATLCVHPDKLQQRGASIQQKYICEKVFDLLKEAWNKFNSEER
ncbi:DnaJ domain containing protein [Trema orientale]|uniref:DnaJ domain containing protein n=1 Tax=Trema orientale TaxID=63057 RepID=A0A2P5FP95_TREOI|nr:DnaJ domain containing protein [Trema orientale]